MVSVPGSGRALMRVETHQEVIGRLQAEIDKALRWITLDETFALLDFPDHPNVGDSAIWLGELAFFAKAGRQPAYVCSLGNIDWDGLDRAVPHGVIFIHGGGNFGDVWPRHQAFREEVLARYPGRRVVQLPQSIHFTSSAALARTARIIGEHGQLTLLVRDRNSYDLATREFPCQVILCPDMAFYLGALPRSSKLEDKTLLLLRTDKEKADIGSTAGIAGENDIVRADWIIEPQATRRNARRRMILSSVLHAGLSRHRVREEHFRRLATSRVDRGLAMLSPHPYIVSDRLHVHILSTLLGARHCMLDNNYGKITRFIDTWSTQWIGALRSEDLAGALSLRSAAHRESVS